MTDARYPVTFHNDQAIVEMLDRPLDPAIISERSGRGGTKQTYIKKDIIDDLLNETFGPLGWSFVAKIHKIDDWEVTKAVGQQRQEKEMAVVMVVSEGTLTIKARTPEGSDTVFGDVGVGYGEVEATANRKDAMGMAIKGAATDALKRCASHLGKRFGMFLVGKEQSDIRYAHSNDDKGYRAAKSMRDQAARQNGGGGDGGRQAERGQAQDDRRDDRAGSGQREDTRGDRGGRQPSREQQRDDRSDGNRGDNSGAAGRGQDDRRPDNQSERDQGSRTSNRDGGGRSERDERPARDDSRSGGEGGGKGRESGKTQVSTNYDLRNIPVSRQEQLDFGATLVARVGDMLQTSDREALVRQHIQTVDNLDAKIRERTVDRLKDLGVDVEKIHG